MSFIDELTWRGLIQQSTDPGLGALMAREPFTLYSGFDPTADSLHVGSLLPLLTLVRAQRAGHRPIALVGGATGMIGDPSGKSEERKLLGAEDVERNVAGLKRQMARFLEFTDEGSGARLVNNADWFRGVGFLDFLRDVGKHFSVNMMLAKESVRARLEAAGISYTEFSYMLIQAYDFLWLHDHFDCRLQIGGSDQWGNITLGIDLIRRQRQREAYGLTTPLLLNAQGQKFGKSEKGAVWLDAERTSPYELYQYLLRTEDADIGRLLRFYTFLDERTIGELDAEVARAPEKREAQRALAREVVRLVHGDEELRKAEQAASALFGAGSLASLDAAGIEALFKEAPSSSQPRASLESGLPLIELLARAGVCASKSAARRDVEGGGIYVNDERVADAALALSTANLLAGQYIVLRKGKKSYHLVRFA
jgi:tyrosyl-tRNA synthetase